ncbi:MAG: pyridoxal phosphate-dependent aminotransferase [Alphaproteobacteria bacterium]|nr:pyridoxal phosphate-dependent aminotransferase [Alphaproteobacteria bacterium]
MALSLSALSRYSDPRGSPALRGAISAMVGAPQERVIVTDGASGALLLALALVAGPGARVLLPSVGFPLFEVFARMVGAEIGWMPVRPDGTLDPEVVRAAVDPDVRAIVTCSPHNPLGGVQTEAELRALASLGPPLICDEVYVPLVPGAPSAVGVGGDALIVGSLSKSLALPGLRIGWLIVPERRLDEAIALKAALNVTTSLPSQHVALRVLEDQRAIVRAHRAWLAERRALFVAHGRALGLDVVCPDTAPMYGLIRLPSQQAALPTARRLAREAGVAVAPGEDFGPWSAPFLRVTFARPASTLKEGLERLGRALRTSRPYRPEPPSSHGEVTA